MRGAALRSTLLTLVVGASALAGCAHTRIETSDPQARIYVDGELVGRGSVDYDAHMGLPGEMVVEVKTPSQKVERVVEREFTVTTFVVGLLTYCTGWVWAWEYPDTVVVMLPEAPGASGEASDERGSSWDAAPRASAWDAPPGGDGR